MGSQALYVHPLTLALCRALTITRNPAVGDGSRGAFLILVVFFVWIVRITAAAAAASSSTNTAGWAERANAVEIGSVADGTNAAADANARTPTASTTSAASTGILIFFTAAISLAETSTLLSRLTGRLWRAPDGSDGRWLTWRRGRWRGERVIIV